MTEILITSAIAVAALMALLWAVSLARADASIVDIAWGAGFALVAVLGAVVGDGAPARRWLVAVLGALWPDYADYVRRTSAFVPLPPRRHA